jgi:hypothetical protein
MVELPFAFVAMFKMEKILPNLPVFVCAISLLAVQVIDKDSKLR